MVNLLAEILFSSTKIKKQHLSLIENGIGSVVEKCQQANEHSIFLQSELLGELHQINRLKKTNQSALKEIVFSKGIATWATSPDYAASELRKNDINYAIVINEAPNLSEDYQLTLSSYIIELLRRHNFSEQKTSLIKEELGIGGQNLLDLEATYDLITKKKIGKISFLHKDIVGKIAEKYMQYFISNKVSELGRQLKFSYGYEPLGKHIKLNGNRMVYKTASETDFILTHKTEESIQQLMNDIQVQPDIIIVENSRAWEESISYSFRNPRSRR